MIKNMVTESTLIQMEGLTKETGPMENNMVREHLSHLKEPIGVVSGMKERGHSG